MNRIQQATYRLAQACEGNTISTTIVVILFYLMFSVLEATVETLIFGHRLVHFLDPIFVVMFIGYSAYAVYWCAVFNGEKNKASNTTAETCQTARYAIYNGSQSAHVRMTDGLCNSCRSGKQRMIEKSLVD